jgi:dienelactone hydrolase
MPVAARVLIVLLPLAACAPSAPSSAQAPEHPFAYDRSLPLDVQREALPARDGLEVSRLTFASPGGGRASAWVAAPPLFEARHAALVLLHGLPGNAQGAMQLMGYDLAARGAVVVALDAPWARRSGLPEFTVRDSVEQVQLLVDLQRVVDYLLTRADVDPARIGYVGGSYGGAMGAAFVGIERRLRAANLFVPDGGLVAHFTTADGTAIGPLATVGADAQARWLAAMRPIEPIRFVGTATIPLLIQNGRTDPLVTVEDAEALHAAAGPGKVLRWYDAGHNLGSLAAARADRLAFLARELGIRGDG